MSALTHAEPCRVCFNPAWTADDIGAVHHCCAKANARGEPCPYCKPAKPPLARTTDPLSSHAGAARMRPKAGTRRSQVLDALLGAKGAWVDGWTLCTQMCGGTEGLRRLRELRELGWAIEVRSHPDPAQTGDQYRIDPEAQG